MWVAIPAAVLLVLLQTSAGAEGPPGDLTGSWQVVSYITAGYDLGQRESAQFVFAFTKDQGSLTRNKTVLWKAEIRVQPDKQPRAVDIFIVEGENGKPLQRFALGIYEIKEGQLRICMSKPGSDRPQEKERPGTFVSTQENRYELYVGKRVEK
jgi:uncharacterized protein (TIGR03067 family)